MEVRPSLAEARALLRGVRGATTVPIYAQLDADLLTPVAAYLKVARGSPCSFLLESVVGGERLGRHSFIGAYPTKVVRVARKDGGDPLAPLEAELGKVVYVPVPGLPTFTGGAVGFVGYDAVHHFEPATAPAAPSTAAVPDPLGLPEAVYLFCDTVVIFDHLFQLVKVVTHVHVTPEAEDADKAGTDGDAADGVAKAYAEAVERLRQTVATLQTPDVPLPVQPPVQLGRTYASDVGQAGYEAFVRSLKHHIHEGDIIQAVPSQRLARPTDVHPFNLYRRLRTVNPSPYMFYCDLETFQLVGASPETLVKVTRGEVETHPIAGTRRRGGTDAADAALAAELLADEKERAEHIMLVDLGRNDVNRIADPATVRVVDLMHIERFSHVMHIVSRVLGTLRPECTPFDAFRSIFPAGTVSGAPKVRAVQLVGQLEQRPRGVYAGAVGYFAYSGDLDTCIALRTMVVKDGVAYLQAGAGIVFDSDPTSEYEETMVKLGANLATIRLAEEAIHRHQHTSQPALPASALESAPVRAPAPASASALESAPVLAPAPANASALVSAPVRAPAPGSALPASVGSTPALPASVGSASALPASVGSAPAMPLPPNVPANNSASGGPRVLMIDNYDSFTWNVYQCLRLAGAAEVAVYRNDAVSLDACIAYAPTHVVISPGPGRPADAAMSNDVLRYFAGRVPVLGVCLGEQCIYEQYGGVVTYAGEIKHGKTSPLVHDGRGVFANLPQGLNVIRYHSLAGDPATLPPALVVTAQTVDRGIVMGVRHVTFTVEGVQFHPESILTEHGIDMLRTFLAWSGGRWADMPSRATGTTTAAAARPAIAPGADILAVICEQRRRDVTEAELAVPLAAVRARAARAPPALDFAARLRRGAADSASVAVIGEIKRASPSKGDIAPDADAAEVAAAYARAGAAAVSVLTEPTWFKGTLDDLTRARAAVEAAVGASARPALLRKDFILTEYQVHEARAAGADTLLLIVACLDDVDLARLLACARGLGMEPLVEVNTAGEMERALAVGARVVGVNNRHLRDFTVDMGTTSRLAGLVPRDGSVLLVALSGISGRADVAAYEADGVAAVLVGEALMRAADPGAFLRSLAPPRPSQPQPQPQPRLPLVKICGVRTVDAARAAATAGADLVGIVLVPTARRCVDVDTAQQIALTLRQAVTSAAGGPAAEPALGELWALRTAAGRPLLVGVFADDDVERMCALAEAIPLDLIQLHGRTEPVDLPARLPRAVLRAVHVFPDDTAEGLRARALAAQASPNVVGLLLDAGVAGAAVQGGGGHTFDHTLAAALSPTVPFLLAGGLTPSTVAAVIARVRPAGVDVSSGVEDASTGAKDPALIHAFVQAATR